MMKQKLETLLVYLANRAAEASTWRGIITLCASSGGVLANLNVGECAAVGVVVSQILKILLPDAKPPQ